MPVVSASKKEIQQRIATLRKKDVLPPRVVDELESRLLTRKLTVPQVNSVIKEVEKAYDSSLVQPGEAVGAVAAQSIGEPGTQMSIPGDELVIIKENNVSQIAPIGVFVDNLISRSNLSGHCRNSGGSLIFDVPDTMQLYVPSLGQDERMQWRRLLQVSRHSPNGDLLRIKTRSGRTIKATLSHSFVVRKANRVVPIKGEDLTIGDRIPLVTSLPAAEPLRKLQLHMYLPKKEVWYGSELQKAVESIEQRGRSWQEDFQISYAVPVGVDGLMAVMEANTGNRLSAGYVYPRMQHSQHTRIPDEIELNFLNGWFFGAYLAEGSNTGTLVGISNANEAYQKRVIEFAESLSVNYRLNKSKGQYGPSTTINLHSTLLAKLFERMLGRRSEEKRIPGWMLNSPEEFIAGLLRAYFDGDGSVSVDGAQIRASTNSRKLRDGICLLLSRMGIFASKHVDGEQFGLRIPGRYALRFRDSIGLDIAHKTEALDELVRTEENKKLKAKVTYDLTDMVPGFGTILNDIRKTLDLSGKASLAVNIRKTTRRQRIGRQTLARYVQVFSEVAREKNIDIKDQLAVLRTALFSDVLWDEIIDLELIGSQSEYVYDFTVEGSETFMTSEGLITHNTLKTFHFAGAAEFDVTLGLPRLIEIVDARRNPSTPTMNIYLDEQYRHDEKRAREVAQRIEQTRVERVAQSVEIDLAEGGIVVELDPELLENKGVTPELVLEKLGAAKLGQVSGEGNRILVVPNLREGEEAIHMAKLQKLFDKVRGTLIRGHSGIKRVLINKERGELVLYTEGTNLKGVLRTKGVDSTRTVSNHIHEVAETLGVEAARQVIIHEAIGVLEEQGLDVDIRHIMLVADLMTATGDIRQIGRHGVSGEQSSVLARAAFEVTVKHLIQAAVMGEEDKLQGITESVIIGQTMPMGTGMIDLLMIPPKPQKPK
jgi:DNA-directed RNA polymerase subunit A"